MDGLYLVIEDAARLVALDQNVLPIGPPDERVPVLVKDLQFSLQRRAAWLQLIREWCFLSIHANKLSSPTDHFASASPPLFSMPPPPLPRPPSALSPLRRRTAPPAATPHGEPALRSGRWLRSQSRRSALRPGPPRPSRPGRRPA